MKQILLIDKDPIFTSTISSILARENFTVRVAKDGKEATGALCEEVFDLVITDVFMSFANGFELVNNIRQNESTKHTAVIVISDIANEQSIAHCMRAGADAYLKKPLHIPQLLSGIMNLVRNEKNVAA